ncbi:uncharacterized protein TRIVIDRAFT_70771 [Trichoderma virens Gv29-8]|uniref:Cyanovirin-N domain-containing protein n=1 Tax=Hypocrea virens (strain Gv29-8 / FGSC 10586) TaxID=413071 RepID=G9MUY3_HYPVG|nr:uncharacterized protein TRIVIDRAFT_70771 [Trichoderma virens Gv29-8]EHK21758.1 hypothetical protein TRIVIDRAFT_70771 [Trichoderma virens Gv29-8]
MKSFSVYAILLGVTSAVAASYKTGADKDAISWAPLSRNCNVFKETYQINVYDGINYLYAIGNGGCTAPAGWGGCIRTTCNNNAAIFLCNDHPTSITVPSMQWESTSTASDMNISRHYLAQGLLETGFITLGDRVLVYVGGSVRSVMDSCGEFLWYTENV